MCVHRGLAAGIYTTNNPEACHFVADNCKANVIVVEDQKQLDKILEVSATSVPHKLSVGACQYLSVCIITNVCLHHYQCLSVRLPVSVCKVTNVCLHHYQCLSVRLPMSAYKVTNVCLPGTNIFVFVS